MDSHNIYMHRCLQLAAMAAGHVAPNPMVGAVLVHQNTIIGEGYHSQYGKAHAEVNCINSVPDKFRNLVKESILYVSLEPCNHVGKTAPCSDFIIQHQIPTVVIGCRDSYEKVNGSGIQKLVGAGVQVKTFVMEKEALELNKRFFTFHHEKRPYIILKWAQSNNLKIANADRSRVMISNEFSNKLVHKWRSEEAAIMVGTHTAFYDDPSLTTRLWPGRDPERIVIDKNLSLPAQLHLFDKTLPTIIVNKTRQGNDGNNMYVKVDDNEKFIQSVLNILYQRNIQSLIVEGGAILIQSFIDAGIWDEARVITNKILLIENGIEAPVLKNNIPVNKEQLFSDEICFYRNETK